MTRFTIRSPQRGDYEQWLPLYMQYSRSVRSPETTHADARTLWDWIMQGTHRIAAFLAFDGEALAGFVHYRPFPRTLNGNEACYLDDLYVDGSARGAGLGRALIERVAQESRSNGWTEVRWVTTEDNGACRLYDRVAELSDLLTYRMRLDY